jgi:PAS domain-containing protein
MQENYRTSSTGEKDDSSRGSIADQELSQHMKCLVEDSPIATFTCDQAGQLTFYNHAAVSLWGAVPTIGDGLWINIWKILNPRRRIGAETAIAFSQFDCSKR